MDVFGLLKSGVLYGHNSPDLLYNPFKGGNRYFLKQSRQNA